MNKLLTLFPASKPKEMFMEFHASAELARISQEETPEGIDVHLLEQARTAMGDKFSMMLQYYMEDTAGYLRSISDGIRDQNSRAILDSSHTVKSSSRQLGITAMAEIAAQMEEMIRLRLEAENKPVDNSLFEMLSTLSEKLTSQFCTHMPYLTRMMQEKE